MRKKLRPLALISLALPILACAKVNYQNDYSASYFNDAERASGTALYDYEARMAGGLFAMYPTYWRLNENLASQDANSILNFVRQYQGTVMAEKLVADFAEKKAEMGDYVAVRVVSPYIMNADASERCAIGLGVHGAKDPAIRAYQDVWLDTTRQPALCATLAQAMASNPYISAEDRHARLVRLLRIDGRQLSKNRPADNVTGQIVQLAQQLRLPLDYTQLTAIKSNPSSFLASFNSRPSASLADQYLYIYAISQLAHSSYTQAIAQLERDIAMDSRRPQPLLSEQAKRYAYRSIAVKRMNMNTDDGFSVQALNWFHNSLGEPFNFEEAEDYAQIAIYFGQWQDVINAISAMPQDKQGEPTWQYWLARGYEQLGKTAQARTIYQTLSQDIDYYGLLAKDKLGLRLGLNDIGGNQLPNADSALVMSDPHFARAFLLMHNNAKSSYIDREWNWAVRQARNSGNHNLILHAAKMAHDLGNYPRSIYAMQNSPVRNAALSHPMLYSDAVMGYSRRVGIDPAWAYGIIRQESRFQPAAQSSANAAGLMQIIPGTARQIARSLGESTGNMSNPDTNIRYGTWFLGDLANKTNGQLAVATASYNAGPNAAKAWLPSYGAMSADQYVEAIPYGETRAYVKHVMENATVYGTALGTPVAISQRMGNVTPAY